MISSTAENLKSVIVTGFNDISAKIEEGTTNRSIAATSMNETSSRAHTIVVISMTQKSRGPDGAESATTSIINLVDLAGRFVSFAFPRFDSVHYF